MTVENKQYSANDLEHVKFTADSTNLDSTVQFKQYEYPVIPDKNVGYFVEYLANPGDMTTEQNTPGSPNTGVPQGNESVVNQQGGDPIGQQTEPLNSAGTQTAQTQTTDVHVQPASTQTKTQQTAQQPIPP